MSKEDAPPFDPQAQLDTLDTGQAPRRGPTRTLLVEIHGDHVGRHFELTDGRYTVGRVEGCEILVRSPAVSRAHARLVQIDHGYEVSDLESTNGTYVNDIRIGRPILLRHDDLLKIGGTVFRVLCTDDLEEALSEERLRIARLDGLTQVLNGPTFLRTLEERLAGARLAREPLSVVIVEVDLYGALLQRYGQAALDRVLSLVAGLLTARVRRSDVLGRIEHARFGVILEAADEAAARLKAEQLRRAVSFSTFRYNDALIPVAITAGIASVPPESPLDASTLLTAAASRLPG